MSDATDLAVIEDQVRSLDDTMSPDDVLALYDKVLFFFRGVKELKERCESSMIGYIKATGKDIEAGNGVRYFVGTSKTTKCTDVPGAVEAVMQATGGDFARFCDVLASGALKHGACKKVLDPDVYGRLFAVVVKEVLDEKGQPVKKDTLVRFDEKFM